MRKGMTIGILCLCSLCFLASETGVTICEFRNLAGQRLKAGVFAISSAVLGDIPRGKPEDGDCFPENQLCYCASPTRRSKS